MHPRLEWLSRHQNGVFATFQARGAGYSRDEIRQRLATRRWVSLRRGIMATAETVAAADGDSVATHLLHGAAALLAISADPVLSHGTAAQAWGIPLLGHRSDVVAVTVERQHRRRAPGLDLHTARTPPWHRSRARGLPVTSVARTVSDLARSFGLRSGVVAADAALHAGLCERADLERVISDCWVWRGIAKTKRVLELSDRRSESPGESLSRLAFDAEGIARPTPQAELLLEGRRVRVDFLWPAQRLVGEFDGRVKYGEARDLWAEKQREDLIRRCGYRVVRWVWSEVFPDPGVMLARVRGALASCA